MINKFGSLNKLYYLAFEIELSIFLTLKIKNMEIKDYLHLYLGCEISATGFIPFKLTPRMINEWDEHYKNFSLLLRPLNDMTKDEAKECGIEWVEYRGEEFGSFDPKEFVWLLSKGFDLFGLIKAGLALDASETKPKVLKEA